MHIAQIAPLAESVPPKLYGGTERVVAWLVDELVELGHAVTLFASGDSRTRGRLHPVWPHLGRQRTDPMAATALLLEAISKRAKDFDVIHAHIDWLHLPLLRRLGVPHLTTMHGRIDLPGLPDVIREFPEASFVSISDNQRLPLPDGIGVARSSTGCPRTCFGHRMAKDHTWLFSVASRPRRGPKKPFASHAPPGCPCASPPKYRAPKPRTSRSILSP